MNKYIEQMTKLKEQAHKNHIEKQYDTVIEYAIIQIDKVLAEYQQDSTKYSDKQLKEMIKQFKRWIV